MNGSHLDSNLELGISENLKEGKEWRGGLGEKCARAMESMLKPKKLQDKPILHSSCNNGDVTNPRSGGGVALAFRFLSPEMGIDACPRIHTLLIQLLVTVRVCRCWHEQAHNFSHGDSFHQVATSHEKDGTWHIIPGVFRMFTSFSPSPLCSSLGIPPLDPFRKVHPKGLWEWKSSPRPTCRAMRYVLRWTSTWGRGVDLILQPPHHATTPKSTFS